MVAASFGTAGDRYLSPVTGEGHSCPPLNRQVAGTNPMDLTANAGRRFLGTFGATDARFR